MSKAELIKKSEQAMDYFDYVPDEILYKIVSILSPFDLCTLAKVSRRFQRVCGDKRLWKRLSLASKLITYSQIEMLITSSFPIKELDLSWSSLYQIPDAKYHRGTVSSDSHMTLEKLDLSLQNDTDVIYVLERSRTKELTLDSYQERMDILSSEILKAISKHENLEVLSMEYRDFANVSVDDIQILFNSSNRLEELNLTGCYLSTEQLCALCDHIPETVEKLVLYDTFFRRPEEEVRLRDIEDYEAYFEIVDNAVAKSFEVLFHRVKNLKYFVIPLRYFRFSIARISQYQSLETLRLCGSEPTLRMFEDYFRNPNFVSVLGRMAPKLERIDIVLRDLLWFNEKQRALLRGSARAQVEKLRTALIGIDVEVYDEKLKSGITLYIRRQRANIQ